MKKLWLAACVASLAVLHCGQALQAQEAEEARFTLSDTIETEAQPVVAALGGGKADECDSCGSKSGILGKRCGCDRFRLFGSHGCGMEVGGWLSWGSTVNAQGNRTGTGNAPLGFNNVADGPVLNQLWLYAERAADTGGYGTDWGFRIDYVFGADGPNTQAFGDQGWDFGWNSSRDYGSAIPQIYMEFAVNDLSIKAGHFFTIIGYESVPAPNNFFYSHAYTMFYGEPFTHTGILSSYRLNDCTQLFGGWTMGWDSGFDNSFDASTYLGGFSYDLSDRSNFTYAVIAGNFGDGSPAPRTGVAMNNGDIYMHSMVFTLDLTDRLQYVWQHDLGHNYNLPRGESAQWYSSVSNFFYTINDCWKAGLRWETFVDEDGARVLNNGPGTYTELTLGMNWTPRDNVRVRPEIRWDYFEDRALPPNFPYDNNTSKDLFTFGIDMILTF